MVELYGLALPRERARGHIVFVHGLGGHPVLTFQRDPADLNTFWPLWFVRIARGAGIWTLSYPAPKSNWSGTGLDLEARARTVLDRILVTPEINDGPIVFICHSLGGLVVKQMLRFANENQSNPEVRKLLKRVSGIVFLGTPHHGAALGNWATWLGAIVNPAANVVELTFGNTQLAALNTWFRNWPERPACLAFHETISIGFGKVVDTIAADPAIQGVIAIPIERDHFTICKPDSPRDLMHNRVANFLRAPKVLRSDYPEAYSDIRDFDANPIVVDRQRVPVLPRIARALLLAASCLILGAGAAGLYLNFRPVPAPVQPPRTSSGLITPSAEAPTAPPPASPAFVRAKPVPDTLLIQPGSYALVKYIFSETKGYNIRIFSQDIRWLRSDGSLIRTENNNRILDGNFEIRANLDFEFSDNVYLPLDIAGTVQQPMGYVQLETTYLGRDENGRTANVTTILRIHPSR